MKLPLVILSCLALSASVGTSVSAQGTPNRYRVPDNSDIRKTIPVRDRFLFENFRKGTVYFRNGTRSEAKLNYSYFHSEIQFIDAKNDTLLLAENDYVSRITIDDAVFYYLPQQGHIQQIADFNRIRLGKRQKLLISDTQQRNAHGGFSATVSSSAITTYSDEAGQKHRLHTGTAVIMRKATSYFLMDQNERCYAASRANLLKVFPNHKREINEYCKQHDINFSNEQEIMTLLDYCKTLQLEG